MRSLLAAAAAAAALNRPSGAAGIALESFLSFPQRQGLISCSNGTTTTVAWTETVAGESNVCGAALTGAASPGATFCATSYRGDDGAVISSLTFAQGCGGLLFTRLPSDAANPTHLVVPPSAEIVYVAFQPGAVPSVVARGASLAAAVTFNGTLFAYSTSGPSVHEWNVRAPGPARTLFATNHGSVGDLAWSPSGDALAFRNSRGDHGFIGVYRRGQSRLRWMPPSVDVDTVPAWSPDGKSLAWVRRRDGTGTNGAGAGTAWAEGERGGRFGGPFSVMVADAPAACPPLPQRCLEWRGTPAAREVFRDWVYGYPAMGEVGYGARPMLWSPDGSEIIFGSELSGFTHVTAAAAKGDIAAGTNSSRDLTPLSCDNQDWVVGGDHLYVSHNCDLVDSMGIARVALSGPLARTTVVLGAAHTVSGMGTNGQGMAPLPSGIAYFTTGVASPAAVLVNVTGATGGRVLRLTADQPSGPSRPGYLPFDASTFVTPQLVTFPSPDGLFTIHAQLFLPKSNVRAKAPAVIFTHGGSQRQMYAAFHYGPDYASLYAINQYFAYSGYAVLSINYRMGVGYGRAFRNCEGPAGSPGCGDKGAAEYQDVQAGRAFLGAHPAVDGSRVGIHGLSYGGLNCLQALSRDPAQYKAGACNAPVFNWVSALSGALPFQYRPMTGWGFRNIPVGPESNLAGPKWPQTVDRNVEKAWLSSPAAYVTNITGPIMLIQGDSDANVDFQETVGLVHALRMRPGVHVETLVVPDERHGFQLFENQLLAAERTYEFLARFV